MAFAVKPRPVDALFFLCLRKSSWLGMAGPLVAISRPGDGGEGGVLDRVVLVDDLCVDDQRRLGGLRWLSSRVMSDDAGPKAALSLSFSVCELARRKRLDMVRRKPVAEPRVDRREGGLGRGSDCGSAGAAGGDLGGDGVAVVVLRTGGLAMGAGACWTSSVWASWLWSVWKSCD